MGWQHLIRDSIYPLDPAWRLSIVIFTTPATDHSAFRSRTNAFSPHFHPRRFSNLFLWHLGVDERPGSPITYNDFNDRLNSLFRDLCPTTRRLCAELSASTLVHLSPCMCVFPSSLFVVSRHCGCCKWGSLNASRSSGVLYENLEKVLTSPIELLHCVSCTYMCMSDTPPYVIKTTAERLSNFSRVDLIYVCIYI